jgi:cell fate regulator YaaT (PSP1 superfamily)
MDSPGSPEIPAEKTPCPVPSVDEPGSSCSRHAPQESPALEDSEAEKLPTRFVVTVQNRTGDRSADYFCDGLNLKVGDYCVAESDGTPFFGSVSLGRKPAWLLCDKKKPVGNVLRAATDEDLKKAEELAGKEDAAFDYCKDRILGADLQMNLSAVHCSFDGLRAAFIFTAEGRVDFRELVRDLAGFTRMKVEMRQIGVRDEAKTLGGCGPCGKELCCSSFLPDFAPVSIRMAKDQNLSLNPTKIAGVCGRLMCCLSYEHETYKELMSKAPKMNKQVVAPDGRIGRVAHINALRERLGLIFEDGSRLECGLTETVPAHKRPLPGAGAVEPPSAAPKPATPQPKERITPVPERAAPLWGKSETTPDGVADEERKSPRKRSRRRRNKSVDRSPPAEGRFTGGVVESGVKPPVPPAPETDVRETGSQTADSAQPEVDQASPSRSRRRRGGLRRKQ